MKKKIFVICTLLIIIFLSIVILKSYSSYRSNKTNLPSISNYNEVASSSVVILPEVNTNVSSSGVSTTSVSAKTKKPAEAKSIKKDTTYENTGTYEVSVSRNLMSIDVYDKLGNHDGLIKNPNPDSDLQLYDAQIPNSQFTNFGSKTYVLLNAGGEYSVAVHGLQNALAEINIKFGQQNFSYDLGKITKNFVGEIEIRLDYSISPISIDANGDGVFETKIYPKEYKI